MRRTVSGETHMHAFTHVHTPSRTHTTHLPPAHTFLILLPLLMADAFCSLLFPFSLSLSAPPFPFSISSFFLSAAHAVGFSSQPPSLSLSTSLPPSFPLPLVKPLPPSPLLSLFSVCRARGHYLSHSGHVRWNGRQCSEQEQREMWGIVASSSRLGNSSSSP